eukprot:TRINITY_DN8001_c0_g1_i1.p2 TRINITY_DN8001_c0_g1~~TRINITY_DN8001_c0_g1_i1.p2  ORF type:complete len:236 (+),score=58.35 TRINITY_DN8001_c0_g1_i1:658-1365(+)
MALRILSKFKKMTKVGGCDSTFLFVWFELTDFFQFVSDDSGTAIQVVYKRSAEVVVLRVGLAIGHSPEEVLETLLDVPKKKDWDVKFHKGRVVKQISDNIDIVHESYKSFNSPYKYRDFCLLRSWRKEADGGYVVMTRSVQHPDVPEQKDSVRASMQASGFLLTPVTSHESSGPLSVTLLLWIAQLDREGILIFTPDLLNETNELFQSFQNFRKVVSADAQLAHEKKTTTFSKKL